MAQPQFNFVPARSDSSDVGTFPALVAWLNKQFARIATALTGPEVFAAGNVSSTKTLTLDIVDPAPLTLQRTNSRAGAVAYLELTQDATGGRTVTFVNALTTPAISTTALKKTLVLAVNDGAGWVLMTIANGF
jgi:beta-lactamase class A